MRKRCERTEVSISAWLDAELGRRESAEMLDHLTRCAGCREFYRAARALGGLVDGLQETAVVPPPTHLWDTIVEATTLNRRKVVATWALRIAAVLLVTLGVVFGIAPRIGRQAGLDSTTAVEVTAGRVDMTEERFIELAVEVLEADKRYQRAMYRAMEEVLDEAPPEGGGEERRRLNERPRDGERTAGRA